MRSCPIVRTYRILLLQALFFVFITVLACLVLGHWPVDVRVSVVNEEADCSGVSADTPLRGLEASALSCTIIRKLLQRSIFPVGRFDDGWSRLLVSLLTV